MFLGASLVLFRVWLLVQVSEPDVRYWKQVSPPAVQWFVLDLPGGAVLRSCLVRDLHCPDSDYIDLIFYLLGLVALDWQPVDYLPADYSQAGYKWN